MIKGKKLDDNNYDMWHRKIQYLLNEQEVLETLAIAIIQPKEGNSTQHHCDIKDYTS